MSHDPVPGSADSVDDGSVDLAFDDEDDVIPKITLGVCAMDKKVRRAGNAALNLAPLTIWTCVARCQASPCRKSCAALRSLKAACLTSSSSGASSWAGGARALAVSILIGFAQERHDSEQAH